MKKQLTGLALLPLLLTLAGCGKKREAACYLSDKGADRLEGQFALKCSLSASKGVIDSLKFSETYSPNYWAKVKAEDKDKVETIEVPASYQGDEATESIYLAKHIYVNGRNWTGTLRDFDEEASYIRYGEYVKYTADDSSGEQDSRRDLLVYLNVADADQYKLGSFLKTYYNDVREDKIKILKEQSKEEKDGKEVYTYTDSSLLPSFPVGKNRLEDPAESELIASVKALETYLKGKKLNYFDRITDENLDFHNTIKIYSDLTYRYNPSYAFTNFLDEKEAAEAEEKWERIDGCRSSALSLTSLDAYRQSANKAFASVEFESKW